MMGKAATGNFGGLLSPYGKESGVTLIELLSALLISAFIMAMASGIFLSGNSQYQLRSSESRRLEEFHRLKSVLQGMLQREVTQCASLKLFVLEGEENQEAFSMLKERFSDLSGAEFRCLEPASNRSALVEWNDWNQPRLIEYRIMLTRKGSTDTLAGSWLK